MRGSAQASVLVLSERGRAKRGQSACKRKVQGHGYRVGIRLSSYHGTVNSLTVSTLRPR
jgi:hypothetical protein